MPPPSTLSLRPAEPNVEDGRVFAKLLEQAQEGAFRMMLGSRVEDIIATAFTSPGHDLSHEHATFAEQNGIFVGLASGYTSEAHDQFTYEALKAASGSSRYRMAIFMRLAERMLTFMDTIPHGDYYIRALAVDPEHRGSGIGTVLMGSLEEKARSSGSQRLALDVSAKNRGARSLYERFGMTVVDESPLWFGLPNTNVIRMVKPL